MAVHLFSPHHSPSFSSSSSLSSSFEQEDYIDLEVSSIFHSSTTSPNSSSREFEFHMTSSLSLDHMDPTKTSPADQLFYNGKLLPLQIQLQNLLHENQQEHEEEELYSTPFATPPSTPIVGCHVSRELVSEDYAAVEEEAGGDRSSTKLMWTRKIKEMIRQSLFKTKLNKIPKSLFGIKSGCSHQSSCATTTSLYQGSTNIKVKDKRVPKRHPKVMWVKDSAGSTSSISSHSTRLSEIQLLQRLHESPIQGAIKHCKQSQYLGNTKPCNMV